MSRRNAIKHFVLLIALSSCFGFLRPATETADAPTNDPLLIYQWPLFNRGQSISQRLDDNTAIDKQVSSLLTLGWKNFDALMKRDVVVAVIDSGVDMEHPELQGVLLKGLNLLARSEREKTFVDDDKGHGTHMASIIAARSNDGKGMSGLSNRIKILPIKVYDVRERPNAAGRKALTERMIQALDHAIEQKVDVINLSMGWPRAKDGIELERAFQRAIDAGIVIVAGAGNDGHEALIYPCAYPNVICVGSLDVTGEVSDFSNFGGHVDLLAPGQEILGLWPTTEDVDPPIHFGPRGYEILSGTSQATPMVAATAAILKGIYPHESGAQIRRRVLQSASRRLGEIEYSQVNFGLLNMTAATEHKIRPFVAPVFKNIEMVVVNPKTLEFVLPVAVESSDASLLNDLQIESKTLGVSFSAVESLAPGRYQVKGRLDSIDRNNRLRYAVKIQGMTFHHQILMVVNSELAPSERIPLPDGRLMPVMDLNGVRDLQFWSYEEQTQSGLKIALWTRQKEQWLKREIALPSSTHLLAEIGLGLLRGNWLLNGRDSYLVAAKEMGELNQNNERELKAIRFFYLDENFKIAREFEFFDATDDVVEVPAYRSQREVTMARVSDGQGGHLQVPVFQREGRRPKADQNPDYFAFDKNPNQEHLYFLQPVLAQNKWVMKTRVVDSWKLSRFFKEFFDLDERDEVFPIGLRIQSQEQLMQGKIQLMVFVGRAVKGRTFNFEIQDLLEPASAHALHEIQSQKFDLKGGAIQEAWSIAEDSQVDRATEIQTLYSLTSGRSLFAEGQGFRLSRFEIPLSGEKIVATLKSVVRGSDQLTLIETSDYIRAQGIWNGRKVQSQVLSYRSTFLPGHLFSQIYVPVLVGRKQHPGLMMDNSQFFSRSVSVYALNDKGQMESPVRLSFQIPEGCAVGSRLALWNKFNFSQIMFRCQKAADSAPELLLIDLE